MHARGRNPNTNAVPPAPPPPGPGHWLPSTHGTKLLTWFGSGGWSRLPSLSLYHGGNNLSPACPTYRNAHKRGGAFDVTTESGAQDIKKEKGQPGQDLAGGSGRGQGRRLRSGVFHPQRFENEFSVNKKKAKTQFSASCWVWGGDERLPCVRRFVFPFCLFGFCKLGQMDVHLKQLLHLIKIELGSKMIQFSFCPPTGFTRRYRESKFFLNTLKILINPNCCH